MEDRLGGSTWLVMAFRTDIETEVFSRRKLLTLQVWSVLRCLREGVRLPLSRSHPRRVMGRASYERSHISALEFTRCYHTRVHVTGMRYANGYSYKGDDDSIPRGADKKRTRDLAIGIRASALR